jgi:hypothetical protein
MNEIDLKDTKNNARDPFFMVPSRVFEMELNPYELSVLFYLMMRADNEKHTCFPSINRISQGCGMSERKARSVIHSLKEKEIIEIKPSYVSTHKNFNRQTSNHYLIKIWRDGAQYAPTPCTPNTHSLHDIPPPPARHTGEINKTKPNITKTNITTPTELSEHAVDGGEIERNSFLKLKEKWFEILKNDKGFEEENISLLDRALEHLWFKKEAEYEGNKYPQNELWRLLCDKCTPEILVDSVAFLSASREPIRSPVAYLGKCILGGLINGFQKLEAPPQPSSATPKQARFPSLESAFDVDDFFAAAMRNTYGDEFKF